MFPIFLILQQLMKSLWLGENLKRIVFDNVIGLTVSISAGGAPCCTVAVEVSYVHVFMPIWDLCRNINWEQGGLYTEWIEFSMISRKDFNIIPVLP